MKYFTPELLNRFRSDDENVSARAHDEWEKSLQRYERREARIKTTLPEGVRRFLDEQVCLHDARLLNMGKHGDTFVMVLEKEPPSRDLVILRFTLDAEMQIADTPLKGKSGSDFMTWMYEEWDIDRRQRCSFAVLLSNGWIVKLRFRDFQHLIVQQVMPGSNGLAAPLLSTVVPRSA
jgi:hypothetical protein